MQTIRTIRKILLSIEYKNWSIIATQKGDGFLLQVQFMGFDTDGSGKEELQKCRKWYISAHSCDAEIIRTCFLAIKQAEEHEICERFKYKGEQIYNPHIDPEQMIPFIKTKPFQTRTNQ